MSDIHAKWPAKLVNDAICIQEGIDPEKEWVEKQFAELSTRQQSRWKIDKIRKYLLECFCEPKAVENKIAQIIQTRYEESIRTGKIIRIQEKIYVVY